MAANNDCVIRVFDSERYVQLNRFTLPWPVNVSYSYLEVRNSYLCSTISVFCLSCSLQNTSMSPDGKLLAVLGDSTDCLIADPQSGKVR
jgi:hypothetical protein